MRRNPQRRNALINAAIEVLAREGGRGLTFRAVDTAAGVPPGTASNYFSNRDDLLHQAGERIHQRLTPPQADWESAVTASPSRDVTTTLMRHLVRHILADRTGYLALHELRLEAVRRPVLREALTRTVRDNLTSNIAGSAELDLPGDELTVVALYLAISGMVVELLTLPDVLDGYDTEELIAALVDRAIGGGTPRD